VLELPASNCKHSRELDSIVAASIHELRKAWGSPQTLVLLVDVLLEAFRLNVDI
jgi:hypothetical protein